jgi:hypothetical protein
MHWASQTSRLAVQVKPGGVGVAVSGEPSMVRALPLSELPTVWALSGRTLVIKGREVGFVVVVDVDVYVVVGKSCVGWRPGLCPVGSGNVAIVDGGCE